MICAGCKEPIFGEAYKSDGLNYCGPGHVPKEVDVVNHPPHYTAHPSGVECITVVEWMTFNLGNAVKYIWRAGEKDPAKTIEDLRKSVWYIQREIERLEKSDGSRSS